MGHALLGIVLGHRDRLGADGDSARSRQAAWIAASAAGSLSAITAGAGMAAVALVAGLMRVFL